MDEFKEKQAVSETQSVDTKKPKYNLMCVLSFIFGVMAVILGSFDNQSYFLYGACCLVSIIGIGFAFVGRINAYTTKTKGNKSNICI